jgi:hypothetical protein
LQFPGTDWTLKEFLEDSVDGAFHGARARGDLGAF